MNTEAHKRTHERLFESARAALLARVCTIHLPPSGPPTSAEPLPRPSRRRGRHHLPVSSHVTRFRSLILTVSAREASRGARLAWSLHLSRDGAQWLLWCAASLAGAVPLSELQPGSASCLQRPPTCKPASPGMTVFGARSEMHGARTLTVPRHARCAALSRPPSGLEVRIVRFCPTFLFWLFGNLT